MAGLQLFRQDDFTGGLNLRADQFQLGENESPSMLNVEIDPRGGISSRGGMTKIVNTAIASGTSTFINLSIATESFDTLITEELRDTLITESSIVWSPKNLFAFNGSTHQLWLSTGFSSATNGKLFYSIGANFTDIGVGVVDPDGAGFAAWGSTLFITTYGQSYSWNGSTATALNSSGDTTTGIYTAWGASSNHMPQAKHCITHAGKMFVANTKEYVSPTLTAFPNRIRWSDESLVSPTRWSQLNYIDINDGGEGITGLASFNGVLIVFKEFATYAILGYNSDNFQVIQLSNKVGTISKNTVCTTERGVYFFSWPDGLYFYNGKEILDVFENIRPIIKTAKVNSTATNKIFVEVINNRIWVSLPYSESSLLTEPSVCFVHDPTLGTAGWTMFQTSDGYGIAGGCTFTKSDGTIIHAVVHPVVDSVLSVDLQSVQVDNIVGSDEPFSSYYTTRWIDGRNYAMKKMFRRPDFVVKQATTSRNLRVGVYHDYEEASEQKEFFLGLEGNTSTALWGTARWDQDVFGQQNVGAVVETGSNLGLARSVQLKISGPTGLSWGMDSFTIKYNPRKVRA